MIKASRQIITNLHLHHILLVRFDFINRNDVVRCLIVLKYLLLVILSGLSPVWVELNVRALGTDGRIAHLMGNRECSGFHRWSSPLWVAIIGQGIVVSLGIHTQMSIIELNLHHSILSDLVLIFLTSDSFTLECVHIMIEQGPCIVFVLRYGVWWQVWSHFGWFASTFDREHSVRRLAGARFNASLKELLVI